MPEDAVYVGRPTRWGNPWRVVRERRSWLDEAAHRHPHSVYDPARQSYLGSFACEDRARYWAAQGFRRDFDGDLAPLRDKRLACWCPLDQPCHADVLIELLEARGW
jgi:hypothetical protein